MRKSLFEYFVLLLFIMCTVFAIGATLEYTTVARERLYLLQGKILLLSVFMALALLLFLRIWNRSAPKINQKTANCIVGGIFAFLLILAVALRAVVIKNIVLEPESDFATYYELGSLLSRGKLQSTQGQLYREYVAKFPHTIGYPSLVLQPVFNAFGISVFHALIANLVLSVLSVCLMFFLAYYLLGRLAALGAMLAMAVWPSHVLYSSMVASEPLFTFLILSAFLLFVLVIRQGESTVRSRNPILAAALLPAVGFILALANSVRPMALVLLIAMLMVFLLYKQKGSASARGAEQILNRGWLCAGTVLLAYLLTGTAIKQQLYAKIEIEPAGGIIAAGYNFMVGTNLEHKGVWNQEDTDFFNDIFQETGSATEAHKASMEIALERLAANPEDILDLFVYKFRNLWQTDDFGIDWNLLWLGSQDALTPALKQALEAVRPPSRQGYLFLLVCVLAAAVAQWLSRRRVDPVFFTGMLFFLGTAMLHMLLETQVRYHYNILPFLMLLGTYVMVDWRKREVPDPGTAPPLETPVPASAASIQPVQGEMADTYFDLGTAVREGYIVVTMSQSSAEAALASSPAAPSPEEEPFAEAGSFPSPSTSQNRGAG